MPELIARCVPTASRRRRYTDAAEFQGRYLDETWCTVSVSVTQCHSETIQHATLLRKASTGCQEDAMSIVDLFVCALRKHMVNRRMHTTKPAPAETQQDGAFVPGTIGFEMYLASIGASAEALRTPKTPKDKK